MIIGVQVAYAVNTRWHAFINPSTVQCSRRIRADHFLFLWPWPLTDRTTIIPTLGRLKGMVHAKFGDHSFSRFWVILRMKSGYWQTADSAITGCAVAQHCYNGDFSFLWEKWKLWPPVKSKPLNRLTHNLSGLITSTRWTFVPNLVKIRSRETSGKRGEI